MIGFQSDCRLGSHWISDIVQYLIRTWNICCIVGSVYLKWRMRWLKGWCGGHNLSRLLLFCVLMYLKTKALFCSCAFFVYPTMCRFTNSLIIGILFIRHSKHHSLYEEKLSGGNLYFIFYIIYVSFYYYYYHYISLLY